MARLRQIVIAARELEPAVAELRAALPLGEPYADPGVALFGLRNAVMTLGDGFVEVVSPADDGTAAGRFLERCGDGPYMLIFQVDDLAAARERARALGIREVWSIALDDIAAVHLHPADTGAAIVSLDQPVPPASWRWGGPDWTPTAGAIAGATVTVADPGRWHALLGDVPGVDVRSGEPDAVEAFAVDLGPGRRGEELRLAGARFVCV